MHLEHLPTPTEIIAATAWVIETLPTDTNGRLKLESQAKSNGSAEGTAADDGAFGKLKKENKD